MKKFIVTLFLFSLLVCNCDILAFSLDSWFETESIDDFEAQEIFKQMDMRSIEQPDNIKGFTCFDVNIDGDFIIGYDDSRNNALIFNEKSDFLYGFSFEHNASIGVQFNFDNVIIYRTLSDLVLEIDKTGNLIAMSSISNTTNNNSSYNRLLYGNERKVGNVTYRAEKSIFFSSMYSKLVKIDSDGTETVLLDVTDKNIVGTIIVAFLIVSAFAGVITYFIVIAKREPKEKAQGTV